MEISKAQLKKLIKEQVKKIIFEMPENDWYEQYDLSSAVLGMGPDVNREKVSGHAVIQASAGKMVTTPGGWTFWYDENKQKWYVADPKSNYPMDFDSTKEAVEYFLDGWIHSTMGERI